MFLKKINYFSFLKSFLCVFNSFCQILSKHFLVKNVVLVWKKQNRNSQAVLTTEAKIRTHVRFMTFLTKLDRFSNWAREPCTLSEEKILFLTFSLSFSCLLIGYASERSLFIGSCLALLLFMSWVPIKGLIFVSSCLTWRQKSSKFILAPSLEEDWNSFFMLLCFCVIFQRILFC